METGMKQERTRKGWTQSFVAEKIGVSRVAVQLIENGKIKPSYDVLVKLENLFHKSHRQLFAVADETPNKEYQKKR